MSKQSAQKLIDFLYESPSPAHHVLKVEETLLQGGFSPLKEDEKWHLEHGKKYYFKKNNSALIAFKIGNANIAKAGIRAIGAHTDSPGFRIKANPEMQTEKTYLKFNTEMYGGALAYTWFDRPLSIAGKVMVKGPTAFSPITRLVNFKRPVLTIPSIAIHLNRDVNDKFGPNFQKDTLPLVSLVDETFERDGYLQKLLAKELNISAEDVLGFELDLYAQEKGTLLGINEEFISCQGLDDKWMVYAALQALLTSKNTEVTQMVIYADHEEIGSQSHNGAKSNFITHTLKRIAMALGVSEEGFYTMLSRLTVISADLAHAVHPNAGDLHDPTNRPVLGGGPVLKVAASGSYSTCATSAAIFRGICKEAGIPFQTLYNRSDIRGGSTIGPMTAAQLGIPVIDMGAPLLAMHSIKELASVEDHALTMKFFQTFFDLMGAL